MLTDDIAAYLKELGINRAWKTVSAYQCGLNLYVKLYPELTAENIVGFASWLSQNYAHRTMSLYLSAVSCLARWMARKKRLNAEAYMEIDSELKFVRGGRKPVDLPKVPIEGDVQKVVGAALSAFNGKDTKRKQLIELRNLALIHTLRSTGCRVSEVVGLHRNDLRTEDRAALVTGKGSKQRLVYFDDTAWSAVTSYLSARDATGVGGLPNEIVFCRYDREATGRILAITTNVVRYVLNQLEKDGQTAEHLWPHRFRHRYGMRVLAQTHDLAATQDLMGHADPKTTRVYAKLDDEYRQAAFNSVSL